MSNYNNNILPQHLRLCKRSWSGEWMWQYLKMQELKRKNLKLSHSIKICKLKSNAEKVYNCTIIVGDLDTIPTDCEKTPGHPRCKWNHCTESSLTWDSTHSKQISVNILGLWEGPDTQQIKSSHQHLAGCAYYFIIIFIINCSWSSRML